MLHIHHPLPDMSHPTGEKSEEKWRKLVEDISGYVKEGKGVVIHCKAGKGRTGLLVGCVLVRLGMDRGKVLGVVRDVRPGTVQTWGQETYVTQFDK
mmetsp:Transcript_32084/g.50227  ORF Transcript_32084/g.50227 Transcript_32084/m.50227 type:complete len:96 (-) Transcript_32084:79-366(-)